MADKQKKILIIKPSALGDIVHALPTVNDIRKTYQDAHICWLVRPEFAPLLEKHPDIDKVIIFDRKYLGRMWHDFKACKAFFGLIKRLRKKNFDMVFDFQGLFRTAFLGWASGCKNRYGMTGAREFAPLFYNHRIAKDKTSVHVIDYYCKMISQAGINTGPVDFNLKPDAESLELAKKLLNENNLQQKKYVVFICGSAHENKCWPIDKFADLAQRLHAETAMPVVVVGTSSESAIASQLKDSAGSPVIDLCGKTDIPQLVAVLSQAALVISNDTGPGHIAVGLSIPLVLIFGPTNPNRVGPHGSRGDFAALKPEQRGDEYRTFDPDCAIENVPVELVYQKALKQLAL